jgi:hypothetical protein
MLNLKATKPTLRITRISGRDIAKPWHVKRDIPGTMDMETISEHATQEEAKAAKAALLSSR